MFKDPLWLIATGLMLGLLLIIVQGWVHPPLNREALGLIGTPLGILIPLLKRPKKDGDDDASD